MGRKAGDGRRGTEGGGDGTEGGGDGTEGGGRDGGDGTEGNDGRRDGRERPNRTDRPNRSSAPRGARGPWFSTFPQPFTTDLTMMVRCGVRPSFPQRSNISLPARVDREKRMSFLNGDRI